ncbi:four helix bundle protein [Bacteroides oleiciplenus]|uniref:Four helix bundle protein n=1 Tax=Bacteroides oleiciplenus TaxID=626931 RepID=A0A3E5B5U5_9BACE|nr:four helix bundle protein [Bacteroides oleiciplenus]RGN32981.1 four helix bundle protein [Bacteroides oleiciplenus]
MGDSENVVLVKSYAFAVRIVNAFKYLSVSQKEFVLSKQLLRSGTSIGALNREAVHAQSKADFLNKMNIALKEAYETEYWLLLLKDTHYINEDTYKSINADCKELVALLTSIVKTVKTNINENDRR